MRALTVKPGQSGSLTLTELPDPLVSDGLLLARTLAIGICGTDREIVQGAYGIAPPGAHRLIIGHESLAQVVSAPVDSGFSAGDVIVGIVRRPDPVPCSSCAVGEWDMCRNGLYTERGIKGADGYAAEYFTIEPAYAIKLVKTAQRTGVLLEPASIVAKAWDHIEHIGARAHWRPQSVLVTGAGTIGLLAALMGVQRGLDVAVFDRARDGIKPALVEKLGARYSAEKLSGLPLRPDIIVECTGSPELIVQALEMTSPAGILCLAGLSTGSRTIQIDAELVGRTMVLENDVMFGTVNANRRHYDLAATALAAADSDWLSALITRRVPLAAWADAFAPRPDDIKTIIEWESA